MDNEGTVGTRRQDYSEGLSVPLPLRKSQRTAVAQARAEKWKTGMMEEWHDETMECWNDGTIELRSPKQSVHYSTAAAFQNSNIPAFDNSHLSYLITAH
jgi:hypothetical protein